MGKKADKDKDKDKAKAKTPEPEPTPDPPEEQDEGELLSGEFIFTDGSKYKGEYLRKGDDVCLHGDGLLTSGPESFQGTFSKGEYKEGLYKSCNNATYAGTFRASLFHGVGKYSWPDGRVYEGSWKDGWMHGRGYWLNFDFSTDKPFLGFSVNGCFSSQEHAQKEAREVFLAEYGEEYSMRATLALQDFASRSSADGLPAEYLIPTAPEGPAAELHVKAMDTQGLAWVEKLVSGPYPTAGMLPYDALQSFVTGLADGAERAVRVTVLDGCESRSSFDVQRLHKEQLQHLGQAVDFTMENAGPGALKTLVFINVNQDYDSVKARWKMVHCELKPAPQGSASVEEVPPADPPKKKGGKT